MILNLKYNLVCCSYCFGLEDLKNVLPYLRGGCKVSTDSKKTHIYLTHSRLVSETTVHSHGFSKALVVWQGEGKRVLPM